MRVNCEVDCEGVECLYLLLQSKRTDRTILISIPQFTGYVFTSSAFEKVRQG